MNKFLLILIMTLKATCLFALAKQDMAKNIYNMNEEKILKESEAIVIDQWVFCIGKIQSSPSQKSIGLRKSLLEAQGKLSSYLRNKVEWPSRFNDDFRRIIWNEYLKCIKCEITTSKGKIVFQKNDKDKFTTVWAVPEKEISTKLSYDFEFIKKTLLAPENYENISMKLSYVLELIDNEIPESIKKAYINKIGHDYGENIALMLQGKNTSSFMLIPEIDFESEKLKNLMLFLNISPWDPQLCYAIATKMSAQGLDKAASFFYEAGAHMRQLDYKSEYVEKCSQYISSTFKLQGPLPSAHHLPTEYILPPPITVENCPDEIKVIFDYPGRFRVGVMQKNVDKEYLDGKNDFTNGNLECAYTHFIASLKTSITFEALNMAGNTARRINKIDEAWALLAQAIVANPNAVYPWVHLAWIFAEKKDKERFEYCMNLIKSQKKLDKWSAEQLALLERLEWPTSE